MEIDLNEIVKKIQDIREKAEEEIEDKTGETMTTDDEAIIERLGLPIYTSAITSANKLLSRLAIVESLIEKNKKMIKKYVIIMRNRNYLSSFYFLIFDDMNNVII